MTQMDIRSQTAAVIPAYQDEKHIGDIARRTRERLDHVLVVDDGSTDQTEQRAREGVVNFPDHNAVLMANHGVVAYADDLHTAHMHMETVEHFAKIVLTTHLLGQERLLNDAQVEDLIKIRKKLQAAKLATMKRD